MVVAQSRSSIGSALLVEARPLEDGDNAASSESEVVSKSVGLLALLLLDSGDSILHLHRSSPATELVDEVEGHAETRGAERMSLRLESSRGVDQEFATVCIVLVACKLVRLSRLSESESIVDEQLVCRDCSIGWSATGWMKRAPGQAHSSRAAQLLTAARA